MSDLSRSLIDAAAEADAGRNEWRVSAATSAALALARELLGEES